MAISPTRRKAKYAQTKAVMYNIDHSFNMQLSVKPLGTEETPVTLLERANPF
jgi:hypothetical protein